MIQPTVGRVVLVHRGAASRAVPALICFVHSDRLINAAGFDSNGQPFAETSLTLIQEGDTPPAYNYAEWMPYQKGQAAKTEDVAGALRAEVALLRDEVAELKAQVARGYI